MGTIQDQFTATFRDFAVDGVPSSGAHNVIKSEVRQIGALIDAAFSETISVKRLGAVGDGTLHPLSEFYPTLALAQMRYTFATSLTQSIDWCAIQLAQRLSYNSGGGAHPDIDLGFGCYVIDADIQCYSYAAMRGRGAGTSHSGPPTNGWLARGYQTTLVAKAGYNGNMLIYNTASNVSGIAVTDQIIEKICFRGNWTGPGDATNTTGRAIYFDGVYPIQNSYIRECEFHNFAQEGVFYSVTPLPLRASSLWGRYLGGAVVRINYSSTRQGHSYVLEDIQGDYVGATTITTDAAGNAVSIRAGLVLVDASARIGTSSLLAESWTFRDFKHEINSSASSTTAYAPDTIVLHSLDRATVLVGNMNTIDSDPIGIMGKPVTNSVIKLTGTKTPFVYWTNCRLGTPVANTDFSLDDSVNGVTFPKGQRAGMWLAPAAFRIAMANASDIILSGRVRSESTGVADARDRFTITAEGLITYTDGGASIAGDMTLQKISGSKRLVAGGTLQGRRLAARGMGTISTGAFSLSGWGAGASIAINGESNDSRGSITITAGTGPSANPTVVLTYADSANSPWPANPFAVANMGTTGTGALAHISTNTPNTAALTMRYNGTPVAGETYVINYVVMG